MKIKQARGRNSLHVVAPLPLIAAVKNAAVRDVMTMSEYVRRAIIHQLRSDGIDLAPLQRADAA
jgi:hypothetical protein